MNIPWFEYRGIKSGAMGVVVSAYPPITRAQERVTSLTVPGRSGELTMHDGPRPVYEAYPRPFDCYLQPGADADAVFSWLRAHGDLVVGNEPDRLYKARVSAPIELHKVTRSNSYRSFTAIFTVQPFKYLHPAPADITLSNGQTITNPGSAEAAPVFTIIGGGPITLSVGDAQAQLQGIVGGIILDWEMLEAVSLDGTQLLGKQVTGDRLLIPPGDSAISWTGNVSSVVLTPRWRFI